MRYYQPPKHNYVVRPNLEKTGYETWVFPRLAFKKETWDLIAFAMKKVREYAEDENISDSRCIELIAAEFVQGLH